MSEEKVRRRAMETVAGVAEDLMVRLTPGDAKSSQNAGVKYARTLAGAPTDGFLKALAEQESLIVHWATGKGFGVHQARSAAREFAAAAKAEWRRIAGAGATAPGGHA